VTSLFQKKTDSCNSWYLSKKKPPAKPVVEVIVLAELLTRSQFDLNQRIQFIMRHASLLSSCRRMFLKGSSRKSVISGIDAACAEQALFRAIPKNDWEKPGNIGRFNRIIVLRFHRRSSSQLQVEVGTASPCQIQ